MKEKIIALLEKFKIISKYEKALESSKKLKFTDQALILAAVIFLIPFMFFYFIAPAQSSAIKKGKAVNSAARMRLEKLRAEENLARSNEDEMGQRENELKFINGLVLSSDSAIQFLNNITNLVESNTMEIKFVKKNAQFDRVYEKVYTPKGPDGAADEGMKISYKLLPIEIVFISGTSDFICFMHIIEGFKKLNYIVKKVNVSKTADNKIEAQLTIEILVDVNFLTAPKS
ncbi:MAG: hypothetical protein QMC67_07330 [Candidatus Wallbacteria bacterium]